MASSSALIVVLAFLACHYTRADHMVAKAGTWHLNTVDENCVTPNDTDGYNQFDIAILLDMSGSMKPSASKDVWTPALKLIRDRILHAFPVNDKRYRLALATFQDKGKARKAFDFTSNAAHIRATIGALMKITPQSESTYMSEGIDVLRKEIFLSSKGMRAQSHKVVILLSDGKPSAPDAPHVNPAIEWLSKTVDYSHPEVPYFVAVAMGRAAGTIKAYLESTLIPFKNKEKGQILVAERPEDVEKQIEALKVYLQNICQIDPDQMSTRAPTDPPTTAAPTQPTTAAVTHAPTTVPPKPAPVPTTTSPSPAACPVSKEKCSRFEDAKAVVWLCHKQ